uniref:Kynurenine--oxoglutarate transaminase 1 n=1 Tax=Bos mutus grunniens TaxID=30521 RepID=A0A8B9XU21_BOSMU
MHRAGKRARRDEGHERVEFVQLASEEADVVNLGQGFPDFSPPEFAVEAFQHAVSGDFMLNQYTKAFVSLPAPLGPQDMGLCRGPREEGQLFLESRPI